MDRIWMVAVPLIFVYLFTNSVFPGVAVQAHLDFYNSLGGNRDAWYQLTMVTTYNLFDTIGCELVNRWRICGKNTVWIPIALRGVFVFTMIWIGLDDKEPAWLFQSDWFRLLNMALFSLSNGYM